MKNLFFIIVVVFLSCHGLKNSSEKTLSNKSYRFIEFNDFEVRQKPILNREYILFLCWYIDVYGLSYPRKVFEILPENSLTVIPNCADGFEPLFSSIEPNSLFKNYILNPEYLNYPLTGLSEYQVMELENWLSDRYNESTLIRDGYLHYNTEQKDEDCFTTESFLVGQYMGDVIKNYSRNWNKNKFKPVFRLPWFDELNEVSKENGLNNDLVEYSFNSKDFLLLWNQQYISTSEDQDTLKLNFFYAPIPIYDFNKPNEALAIKHSSAFLDKKDIGFTNTQYIKPEDLESYPYPEKEFDGRMKFVVVGTNDENQPIIADRIKSNKNNQMENKIYRIFANKVIDEKYWPE